MNQFTYNTNDDWEGFIEKCCHKITALFQKETVVFVEKAALSAILENFVKKGEYTLALQTAEWGTAFFPYTSYFFTQKAKMLYKESKVYEALRTLDENPCVEKTDTEANLLRIRILIDMERHDQAQELLDEMGRGHLNIQQESDWLSLLAFLYFNTDQFEEEYEVLCRALLLDPKNDDLLDRLSLCAEYSDRQQELIEFLEEYLDEVPYSSLGWYHLGHCQWSFEDLEEAEVSLEYSYLTDKYFTPAYMDRAEILVRLEEYDKALDCYHEAMDTCGARADIWVGKGDCYLYMNEYDKAMTCYRNAIQIKENCHEGYYGIGVCLLRKEQDFLAIEKLSKALELAPRREEYAAVLGEAYYRVGRFDDAAQYFNHAIEVAPDVGIHWIRYATFFMNEGDMKKAFEQINLAYIHSYGVEIKYCHAAICYRNGDKDACLHKLQEAMEEDASAFSSLLNLCPEIEADAEIMDFIRRMS